MGAYLSNPITEKISSDEKSSRLTFGASSMQGWRVSQEDAHNCIIDFDKDTSFFAVYDGHGGAEVAKYCALHLPDCLRSVVNYKNGNISQALEDAFLEFDNCLTKREVVDELKHLSAVTDGSEDEECVAEDTKMLREEAHMPIEELLSRYKGASLPLKVAPHMRNYHNEKPKSPMLRAKKTSEDGSTLVNGENNSDSKESEEEATKCSPSTDLENGKVEKEEEEEKTSSPDEAKAAGAPESKEVAEAGCSHPKSRTNRKNIVAEKVEEKVASGSEDGSEEDEGDEEYSVGDSSSEDENEEEEGGAGDDKSDSEEEEDEDEESDSDDECACLKMAGEEEPGQDSGCTAVVAVLQGNQLYVANAGDSRCVVSRGSKAVDMSFDHKPEDQTEKERIVKAGGEVTMDGRVNGGLNLSRAIGDHSYKKNTTLKAQEQMISAQPDVRTLTIDPSEDDFMVLACDGIWNTMSSQEVVDFVDGQLKSGEERLSAICEKLFEHCLAPNTSGDGTGCDNMTCIVVRFQDLPASDCKKRRSPSVSDERQKEGSKKLKSETEDDK